VRVTAVTELRQAVIVDDALVFGPFVLAGPLGPLRRGAEELKLAPKSLAVLWQLVTHAGQVMTRAALSRAVWPDVNVSDGALSFQIRELRAALDDDPQQARYIATVHRVGFRFVAAVSRARTALAPESTLVGREAELVLLDAAFLRALRGERQVVFVVGEAGIGKTRLCDAWLGRTSEALVARGQCVEPYGASEAYLPLLDAFARATRGPDGALVSDVLAATAPTWLALLRATQDATPPATPERMLREMAEALEALSRVRPVVLVLEDLHWSDEATRALITMVARRFEPARLVLVATSRTPPVGELGAQRAVTLVNVGALTPEAVSRYVAERFGAAEPALARFVFARTEGHPLFMVQVADYLAEHGTSRLDAFVPRALSALIEQQLERVTDDERLLLECASVAGAEVHVAVVASALERDASAVEAAFEALARRHHIVDERGVVALPGGLSGVYGFRHALYQTVLYERIGAARRARIHLAVGLGLERAWRDRAREVAAELAEHFERARDVVRAVHHHVNAAARSLERSAPQQALARLQGALPLLASWPDGPERARAELTLRAQLAEAATLTRGYAAPEVQDAWSRVLTLAAPDDPGALAALWGLALSHLVRASFAPARALGDELLRRAEELAAVPMQLAAHLALGASAFFSGDLAAAAPSFERALRIEVPEPARGLRVEALATSAWWCWRLGEVTEAARRSAAALELARASRQPNSVGVALFRDAVLRRLAGESARTRIDELLALARREGLVHWEMAGLVLDGAQHIDDGGGPEWLAAIRRGIDARDAMGVGLGASYDRLVLARAHLKLGQRAEGLEAARAARVLIDTSGERLWESDLALTEAELGRLG
jgi:DNA-binding winged helix-turn-helix (wHTH) protein/tetratricopeptide (TPR) repeat protein